ncbi:hypothetical protein M9458_045553, partial [Cirrhinus mrigala]
QLCGGEEELVVAMTPVEQVSDNPASSSDLSVTREQILTAQFECYLKIMYDPPRSDP